MEPSVCIMMAVYNGQTYLKEQIDSIVSQTYQNWTLMIQDDGSTDDTISVLSSYTDARIHFQTNTSGYHGPFINFHTLANTMKRKKSYDYYMFCDQDDIWHPDKLTLLVKEIHKLPKGPALVYANMDLVDGQGHSMHETVNDSFKIDQITKYSVFFSHKVYGCNLIMNASLFFLVPVIDASKEYVRTLSHDNLYAKFAAIFGTIHYLDTPTMNYRRHASNVTADQQYHVTIQRLLRRIFGLKELARLHTNLYNQSLVALKMLEGMDLNANQQQMVQELESVLMQGGLYAIRYFDKHQIRWGGTIENTSRRLIFLTKLYQQYLVDIQTLFV